MLDIQVYGDRGMRIALGNSISKETNEKIRSLSALIQEENIEGVLEWIPTYTAVSIFYDPVKTTFETLSERIRDLYENISHVAIPPADVVTIPVCYGGKDFGPDLATVASHNKRTEEEVINIHTGTDYLIYMMGFSPGFPYLGGMSDEIATPRLDSPRTKIPAGSVGIAGSQTGVYPNESPGGWQIIGQTPLKLYDPQSEKPILLSTGNYVRFKSITKEEFETIREAVTQGNYQPEIKPYEGG